VPNFIKIGHTVAEIWRFYGFQNGGRPPSWILKFEFLTVGAVNGAILHQCTKFRKDRSNRCRDVAIFVIFQYSGRRHLGFSKILNFNGRSAVRIQYASLYQIALKLVKRLQRYGDLTVFFQNGSRPPSWICWVPIGTTHDCHLMSPSLCKIWSKSM